MGEKLESTGIKMMEGASDYINKIGSQSFRL